jgi:hypothetical protein
MHQRQLLYPVMDYVNNNDFLEQSNQHMVVSTRDKYYKLIKIIILHVHQQSIDKDFPL